MEDVTDRNPVIRAILSLVRPWKCRTSGYEVSSGGVCVSSPVSR